jgi:hypothetical protein
MIANKPMTTSSTPHLPDINDGTRVHSPEALIENKPISPKASRA